MFANYFKLALRNLQKRPGYTTLHLLGLATGMVCCLLILQYVLHERSYDRFSGADNIHRLELDCYQKNALSWKSATVFPAFAPTMRRDFPEIVDACRLHDAEYIFFNPESDVKFAEKKGYFADPSFLQMFQVLLSQGNANSALDAPGKVVLSEKMAHKYFGQTEVLGRTLAANFNGTPANFEVAGVFREYPSESHLTIDYLVSYKTLGAIVAAEGDTTNSTETAWGWYDFYTYFQFRPDTDMKAFSAKLPGFTEKYLNSDATIQKLQVRYEIYLQPLTDIHLCSNLNQEAEVNSSGQAVSVLFWVALFILGIAWVNYINLATARAVERAREVGVRKVSGAGRGQLVRQFLTESFLLNAAALIVALLAMWLAMPAFSQLVGKAMSPGVFSGTQLLAVLGVFVLGTLLSGLYPAFVLSGFQPMSILKGSFKNTPKGVTLRKGLIVGQFTASVALIIGTIVVTRQVSFMRNQNPGFDKTQTLVLEGPNTLPDSLYQGIFSAFKNEVLQIPGVAGITGSSSVPGDEIYWTSGFARLKSVDQQRNTLYILGADADFTTAYDLPVVAGRNFEVTDQKSALLNETAARLLGFESPEKAVGEIILRGRRDTLTVRGVVRDFHHLGLQKAVDPICVRYGPDQRSFYSLKINGKDFQNTLAGVQGVWQKHFPADPYSFFFLDEFFDRQYKSDVLFGKVFGLFSALAILIACLGLLGLTSYNILQRTKEIGIRKVLGANVTGITLLLAKDFLKLVVASIVIASPIAWWAMNKWLADFAYRIDLQWWMFVLAGVAAMGIAFLTVSFQSVKAALANPVKSLRSE